MEVLSQPDPGMELCYDCDGAHMCIMCQGKGKLDSQRCISCGGQRWCIVCYGAGQLPEGTYQDLIAKGHIKG